MKTHINYSYLERKTIMISEIWYILKMYKFVKIDKKGPISSQLRRKMCPQLLLTTKLIYLFKTWWLSRARKPQRLWSHSYKLFRLALLPYIDQGAGILSLWQSDVIKCWCQITAQWVEHLTRDPGQHRFKSRSGSSLFHLVTFGAMPTLYRNWQDNFCQWGESGWLPRAMII